MLSVNVPARQSGVMLLEALIAILVFSLGILGLVSLQASTVQAGRDAQYRSQASALAGDLVGQMWASDRVGANLQTNFQGDGEQVGPTNVVSDGAAYTAWAGRVASQLPGTVDFPPVVQVTPGVVGPPATATQVSVTVRWRAPNEDAGNHAYLVTFQII